jgi:hypothetical protein
VPISLIGPDGSRVVRDGETSTPDDPPAAPTNLVATAGDTEVSLSWDASPEVDVVDYRVRTTAPTASLIATVTAPATTYTHTGRTNGVQYTYVVRARDAAGQVSENSNEDSATPNASADPPISTIFGYNTNDDGAPLSSRLVKWDNRAPCVRRYNSSFLSSGTFNITTAVAPEKRVAYSFKANSSGSYTKAGLAAGNGNDRLTSWCESIPPNTTVYLTYYHEVNDDIREGGITVAQYRDAYEQFRIAIDAATLQSGVTVKLASNFMAYRVADTPNYFSDSWVPPLGVADLMTFDLYLNPGHFTTTLLTPNCSFAEGGEYGTSFPNTVTRWRDTLEAIVRNGFKDAYGVLEYNTPPRDWDGPANPDYACGTNKRLRYQGGRSVSGHNSTHTEVERAAALVAGVEYLLSQPTILGQQLSLPDVFLFWEHPEGTNWNQKFYHNNVWNALKPYIINTPVGG